MKAKHYDIEVDPENPFGNCKLGRQKYAAVLTNVVQTYADGFVLALNNEWGTGKTTFVKMWQQDLNNQGFKTLYFNAWENDFEQNVLVALISELKELKESKSASAFKSVVKNAAPLAKSIIPTLLKSIATKYVGKEGIQELLNVAIDVSVDGLADEVKAYTEKKEGVKEFKNSLEKFVAKSSDNKPIVFIIDELDRCRPSYSVEVLEQIKHLFSVKGIVFVLSVDKVQLGHAIRGVYGNDSIDSDEYLRRFIDIEYSIPEPDTKAFCEYLYDYFHFNEFLELNERVNAYDLSRDGKRLLDFTTYLFKKQKLNLRLQEKIFAHARLVLNSFSLKNYIFPELYLFIIYLKNKHNKLYRNIREIKFTPQELIDHIEPILPKRIDKYEDMDLTQMISLFLVSYTNAYSEHDAYSLLYKTDENDPTKKILLIRSEIDQSENNQELLRYIHHINNNTNYHRLGLNYLLKRIELTEPIKV